LSGVVSVRARGAGVVGLVVGLAYLLPAAARAGNGLNPRTPVLWEDVPCVQQVDRSVDPVLHLPYAIPREDTNVTADEVDDSRTHQFFAYCRRRYPQEHLPNWITWDDVEAAVATGLVASSDDIEPENVLANSENWQDCWFRITQDDERRPIVFEMADAGVDWDTSSLAAGAYTIYGFTHEPIFNLWIVRPGVVTVHDGDPTQLGPAGAITNAEEIVYQGSTVAIEGCAQAMPGTVVTAYYAGTQGASDPSWQPAWVPFAEAQPIEGDAFSVELIAPAEIAGQSSMIRIDLEDPMGRTYTTYMQDLVIVLAGTDPDTCDDGTGFISAPDCEPTGDASTGEVANETTGDTGSNEADDDVGSGCSCTTSPRSPGVLGLSGLLAWLGFRRRR
jgi:MYXO-CTERM domain-containing protein